MNADHPAAVLCSGPSLLETWSPSTYSDYGTVIAVNHACEVAHAYDWAVICDHEWIDRINWRAATGLCTFPLGAARYRNLRNPRYRAIHNIQTPELPNVKVATTNDLPWDEMWGGLALSSMAAILLAEKLGHKLIDVYGMDLCGTAHCVPSHVDGPEQANRWDRERRRLVDLRRQQSVRGVTWRRACRDGFRDDLSADEASDLEGGK